MEIGLLIRFGKPVPGRERQAVDLFTEASTYWGEKLQKKEISFFEPFLLMTSDLEEEAGLMLVKGPAPEIFRIMEEERYLELVEKATVLAEHFRVDLVTVGEGITLSLERSAKARAELGL